MNDPSCTQVSITRCAWIQADGKDLSDVLDARLMALVVTDDQGLYPWLHSDAVRPVHSGLMRRDLNRFNGKQAMPTRGRA